MNHPALTTRLDHFANGLSEYQKFEQDCQGQIAALEQMRSLKTGDVLHAFRELLHEHRIKLEELDHYKETSNLYRNKMTMVQDELNELQTLNAANRFVCVVLDGDGALFRPEFIDAGRDGGSRAAELLEENIRRQVRTDDPEYHEDWKVMCEVVLNVEGLSRALHASGTVPNALDKFRQFAQGFAASRSYFSIVDVGFGKEGADQRVREVMESWIRIGSCRRVFFGPCLDNGYITFLQKFRGKPLLWPKLSLIETSAAQPGFLGLSLPINRFPAVFYDRLLRKDTHNHPVSNNSFDTFFHNPTTGNRPPPPPQALGMSGTLAALNALSVSTSSGPPGYGATTPTILSTPTTFGTPVNTLPSPSPQAPPQPPTPAHAQALPQQAEAPATRPAVKASPAPTWASLGSKVGPLGNSISIVPQKPKKAPEGQYYQTNKDHERIDKEIPSNPAVESQVKSLIAREGKLCNWQLLRPHEGCKEGPKCPYRHDVTLNAAELNALRKIARGITCMNGLGCEDVSCFYSHNCPFGRNCSKQYGCDKVDTHHMDLSVKYWHYNDGSRKKVA